MRISDWSSDVCSSDLFGSRVVVDRDGMLWLGLGERYQRDEAQDLSNHLGKVIRLARDGSVPPDNPFVGRAGAQPEIWSYCHRNIPGMAINPQTGPVWLDRKSVVTGNSVSVRVDIGGRDNNNKK